VDAEVVAETSYVNGLYFPPTIDGVTNVNHAETAIAVTTTPRIPILIGSNGNEIAQFFPDIDYPTASQLWSALIGPSGPSFSTVYNASLAFLDPYQAIRRPFNQYAYTCRAHMLSVRAAQAGHPTWRYFYNATFSNVDIAYPGENAHGASHGAELPLIFGTFPAEGSREEQVRVGRYVQDLFLGFVRDPVEGLGWPGVGEEEYLLWIDNGSGMGQDDVVGNGVADSDCGIYETLLLADGEV
jgi:carboxylesterase type B